MMVLQKIFAMIACWMANIGKLPAKNLLTALL
jgi:hypothetical protein